MFYGTNIPTKFILLYDGSLIPTKLEKPQACYKLPKSYPFKKIKIKKDLPKSSAQVANQIHFAEARMISNTRLPSPRQWHIVFRKSKYITILKHQNTANRLSINTLLRSV